MGGIVSFRNFSTSSISSGSAECSSPLPLISLVLDKGYEDDLRVHLQVNLIPLILQNLRRHLSPLRSH